MRIDTLEREAQNQIGLFLYDPLSPRRMQRQSKSGYRHDRRQPRCDIAHSQPPRGSRPSTWWMKTSTSSPSIRHLVPWSRVRRIG